MKQAYDRADMPKPRNLVGMAKDVSVAEKQALLLAHLRAVTQAHLRALAAQRAQVVKQYLVRQKLGDARFFLAAPKLAAESPEWTPQAQLSLAAK